MTNSLLLRSLCICFFLGITNTITAQLDYQMPNTSIGTNITECDRYIVDPGGTDGNYPCCLSSKLTVHSSEPFSKLVFSLAGPISIAPSDTLFLYDGLYQSSPMVIAITDATDIPLTMECNSGIVLLVFQTNSSIQSIGFRLHVESLPINEIGEIEIEASYQGLEEMMIENFPIFFHSNMPNYQDVLWHFGDGSTSNQHITTHIFDTPGDYVVSLSYDYCNLTFSTEQTMTILPEADIEFNGDYYFECTGPDTIQAYFTVANDSPYEGYIRCSDSHYALYYLPTVETIEPNSIDTIFFEFRNQETIPDTYNFSLTCITSDADNITQSVPVSYTIVSLLSGGITPNLVTIDTTYLNVPYYQDILITNLGNDTMFIEDIVLPENITIVDTIAFLLPSSQAVIQLAIFNTEIGSHTNTVEFITNAGIFVCQLNTTAIPAPAIQYSNDPLTLSLPFNGIDTIPLIVTNVGMDTLEYSFTYDPGYWGCNIWAESIAVAHSWINGHNISISPMTDKQTEYMVETNSLYNDSDIYNSTKTRLVKYCNPDILYTIESGASSICVLNLFYHQFNGNCYSQSMPYNPFSNCDGPVVSYQYTIPNIVPCCDSDTGPEITILDQSNFNLAPNASDTIWIVVNSTDIEPMSTSFDLYFTTNDPMNPIDTVAINVNQYDPELIGPHLISPISTFHLHNYAPFDTVSYTFNLYSNGTDTVTVDTLLFSCPNFFSLNQNIVIPPNETEPITFYYADDGDSTNSCTLQLIYDSDTMFYNLNGSSSFAPEFYISSGNINITQESGMISTHSIDILNQGYDTLTGYLTLASYYDNPLVYASFNWYDIGQEESFSCTFYDGEYGVQIGGFYAPNDAPNQYIDVPIGYPSIYYRCYQWEYLGSVLLTDVTTNQPLGTIWFYDGISEGYIDSPVLIPTPSWLSFSESTFYVPPASPFSIPITINTNFMEAGEYVAHVTLHTNDSNESIIYLNINLTVTGSPQCNIAQDSIDFGSVLPNIPYQRELFITNYGSDKLILPEPDLSLSSFNFDYWPSNIPAFKNDTAIITFYANSNGLYESEIYYDLPYCQVEIPIIAEIDITNSLGNIIESNELYTIYPNPVKDELYIDFNASISSALQIELANINGQQLYLTTFYEDSKINLQELPNGIYFIKCKSSTGTRTHKIIKQGSKL